MDGRVQVGAEGQVGGDGLDDGNSWVRLEGKWR